MIELAAEQDLSRLSLIKKERQLLLERERRIRENLIFFFKPRPSQEQFFRSTAPTRALFTSNRWGKTTVGTVEAISHSLGFRPFFSEDDPDRKVSVKIPNKGIVYSTDWDKVDEVMTCNHGATKGKFFTFLPSGSVAKVLKNHRGVIDRIFLTNGSSIRFDTYESYLDNPQSAESADYDWAMYDEPPPKGLWAAIRRGLLDRSGREWFTLTPLLQAWLYDDIFLKADGKTIWVSEGRLHDNCRQCNPPFGIIDHDTLLSFEHSLPADERLARVDGKFVHLTGLVYREFSPSHIVEPCDLGRHVIWLSIDPHPRTPHAVLFLAVTEGQQLFLVDEIFEHCLISELCKKIKQKLEGKRMVCAVCDPLAFIEDPVTGSTMADEFARNGIPVRKSSKDRTRGILAVKKVLSTPNGLRVFANCTNTIWEFGHYVYAEYRRSADRNLKEKPKDKDDHFMECLYRLLVLNPTYHAESSRPIDDFDFVPTFDWGSV